MPPTSSRSRCPRAPAAAQGLLVEGEDLGRPARRLLRVTGELDLATVGLLGRAVDRAAADHRHVELDLTGVTFCDVVGATAIERAQQVLEAGGRLLTLRGVNGPLHLLVVVDGLFSTLQAAVLDGQHPARHPGRPRVSSSPGGPGPRTG